MGDAIESRVVLHFKDGSVRDEVATFSQKGVFRLEAYRLVQRGPSFPTMEMWFDRRSGTYKARTQEKKQDEERTASGALAMPVDLYNGMASILLKNLPGGVSAAAQYVLFDPKPHFVKMTMSPEGQDTVRVGDEPAKLTRYLVQLELKGLTGIVASLIGKDPPDARYWFAAGDVPGFVRFDGAMYLNGPAWRLELASIEWPKRDS